MKNIDDTTRIEIIENKIRIKGISDYRTSVFLLFIFILLLAFQMFYWSIIPVLVLPMTILYHNDTYFDFHDKIVYSGFYFGKWEFLKNRVIPFDEIRKIKIIAEITGDAVDPDVYKSFSYNYYLSLKDDFYQLPLSVESLSSTNKVNRIIANMGYNFNFEIDESKI